MLESLIWISILRGKFGTRYTALYILLEKMDSCISKINHQNLKLDYEQK
jgi:hypothetical protein